jgi:Tfp pilus assembly protein PilN
MIRLNLLPPEIKESIEFSKKNASLYQMFLKSLAGFTVLVGVMIIVGATVYYNETGASDEREVAKNQLAAWDSTEHDAKDFADRLALISKLKKLDLGWPLVFSEMAKSTPPNIRLASYDFTNNATSRVSITGYALSNTDIGKYRELLSGSSLFKYVDIESITQGNDPTNSNVKSLLFKISMNLDQQEAKK